MGEYDTLRTKNADKLAKLNLPGGDFPLLKAVVWDAKYPRNIDGLVSFTPIVAPTVIDDAHGTYCAEVMQTIYPGEIEFYAFAGSSKLEQAIDFCIENGIRLINASMHFIKSDVAEAQLKRYAEWGGIICCAAGNNEGQAVNYPASSPYTLAVSATNYEDNDGEEIDVTADSYWVVKYSNGMYDSFNGTSCSTPVVSACVGIIQAFRPEWYLNDVIDFLDTNSVDGEEEYERIFSFPDGFGKVEDEVNIKQRLCDPRNYRKGRRGSGKVEYIVIHYDGNDGATDEGNGNYFANNDTGDTSAHRFIDEDSMTISVPDDCCAFHCGATTYKHPYCRNDNSIGIEMCSDKDANGNYIITEATVSNTVEATKELMGEYGLGLDAVLRHFDVTGKNCPAPWVTNKSLWDDFKARLVETEIESEDDEEMVRYAKLADIPDQWGFRDTIEILMNAGVINGDGSDASGNDDVIDLSHDQVRSLIFEYRGGAFDRALIAKGLDPAVNE